MVEITREVRVSAMPEEVWALIGDFGSIAEWHPFCMSAAVKTVGDTLQRTMLVEEGQKIVVQLESHSDQNRSYSCSMVSAGPLPVTKLFTELAVEADTDGSLIRWSGQFEAGDDIPDEYTKTVMTSIFDIGLGALHARFA